MAMLIAMISYDSYMVLGSSPISQDPPQVSALVARQLIAWAKAQTEVEAGSCFLEANQTTEDGDFSCHRLDSASPKVGVCQLGIAGIEAIIGRGIHSEFNQQKRDDLTAKKWFQRLYIVHG